MSSEKISNEELNKILLYTAKSLPDNPSERGMTPKSIKSFLYKYIQVLIEIVNKHFEGIENSKNTAILEHDTSNEAHPIIRKLIDDLTEKDIELGTEISEKFSIHNTSKEAHPDVANRIKNQIDEHDKNENAHWLLKAWLEQIEEKANNAYNLASGKNKIIPVKDATEMLSRLNDSLNIGDKFILSDENIPDFTLFEKNSESTEAIPFSQLDLLTGMTFMPGKSYISNGYLLVASESGLDVSLLAKAEELKTLQDDIKQNLQEQTQFNDELQEELCKKETKKTIISESAETVILATDTEFNLGLRTSIILSLPESISEEFEAVINFRSGATATSFDAPNTIVFTQDDCYRGRLTPMTNRIYEINIKNVAGVLIAKVGCCDYEVIE